MPRTKQRTLPEAEAEIARLREGLDRIARPIHWMKKDAEAEGSQVNGQMAVQLSESGAFLTGIAQRFLSEPIQPVVPLPKGLPLELVDSFLALPVLPPEGHEWVYRGFKWVSDGPVHFAMCNRSESDIWYLSNGKRKTRGLNHHYIEAVPIQS